MNRYTPSYDFCHDNIMPTILVLIILEMSNEFLNKGYKLKKMNYHKWM